VKQTVFLKCHPAVTHRTFLAEMPVGWRLSPPEFGGEELEISREDFEIPYPGWRFRCERGIIYHEPLAWWRRWPIQLTYQLRQAIRRAMP
jgi:hypothetical protein